MADRGVRKCSCLDDSQPIEIWGRGSNSRRKLFCQVNSSKDKLMSCLPETFSISIYPAIRRFRDTSGDLRSPPVPLKSYKNQLNAYIKSSTGFRGFCCVVNILGEVTAEVIRQLHFGLFDQQVLSIKPKIFIPTIKKFKSGKSSDL